MIKLAKIVAEIEKPKNIYNVGMGPGEKPESELISKGFEMSTPEINPETGRSMSTVTYPSDLMKAYSQLKNIRLKELKPFMDYPNNKEISELSESLYRSIWNVMKGINRLHDIIEREKKLKRHQQ